MQKIYFMSVVDLETLSFFGTGGCFSKQTRGISFVVFMEEILSNVFLQCFLLL